MKYSANPKQSPIKTDAIRKTEIKALLVLSAGGLFFVLALASYFYAEYEYKAGQLLLHQDQSRSVQKCMQMQDIVELRQCYTSSQVSHIERHKTFLQRLRPYFWTLPLSFLTLATILGYSGLIWWGIYQPATRRPMVAISAIGILIQTALFVWILVVRFIGLPSGVG